MVFFFTGQNAVCHFGCHTQHFSTKSICPSPLISRREFWITLSISFPPKILPAWMESLCSVESSPSQLASNPHVSSPSPNQASKFNSKKSKQTLLGRYQEQRASLLGARTLLGAPGLTTRNNKLLEDKKLLGAPGHTTRHKKLLEDKKNCWSSVVLHSRASGAAGGRSQRTD